MAMDPILIGLICFSVLIVFLMSGIWVGIGLGVVGVLTCYVLQTGVTLTTYIPWVVGNSFILTAIPLFIFMGEILLRSGMSERTYQGASKWLAWAPGGLLHSNIGACSLFAAISGSSVATAATIATVALPSLRQRGYDVRLSLGSLAAGGTLGVLIPPSINMIVYGSVSEASVGRLFAGGIIPGILLTILFMIYIGIRAVINPRLLPPRERAFSVRNLLSAFVDIWPVAILMVIILGAIFTGFATPTEAAALGASAALLIALGQRRLAWPSVWNSLTNAVTTTSMVMLIVIGASMLGSVLVRVGTAKALAVVMASWTMPPVVVILLVCLFYVALGCLMDGISMIVVTTPVILPGLVALGFDPVWFGVVLVVLTETAMLTPPVGIILFVIQGVSGSSLEEVVRGSMPFFCILVLGLLLMVAFPSLVLWLPSLFYGS